MITANELKHGNLFLFSGKIDGFVLTEIIGRVWLNDIFQFYIEFQDASNEMVHKFSISQIKPLPLSLELLIKCGFIYREEENIFITKGDFTIRESIDHWHLVGYSPKHTQIKYLHQLQNLYYSLTGQELEVSLDLK